MTPPTSAPVRDLVSLAMDAYGLTVGVPLASHTQQSGIFPLRGRGNSRGCVESGGGNDGEVDADEGEGSAAVAEQIDRAGGDVGAVGEHQYRDLYVADAGREVDRGDEERAAQRRLLTDRPGSLAVRGAQGDP